MGASCAKCNENVLESMTENIYHFDNYCHFGPEYMISYSERKVLSTHVSLSVLSNQEISRAASSLLRPFARWTSAWLGTRMNIYFLYSQGKTDLMNIYKKHGQGYFFELCYKVLQHVWHEVLHKICRQRNPQVILDAVKSQKCRSMFTYTFLQVGSQVIWDELQHLQETHKEMLKLS